MPTWPGEPVSGQQQWPGTPISGPALVRRPDAVSPQDWFRQTYGRPPTPADQPIQTRWQEDPEGMRAWNEYNSRQLEQQFGEGGAGFVPSEAPPLVGDPMSQTEMALRTFGQGATLGLADDVARLVGADNWAMQQERGPEMFRETNPIEAGALDLAGNAIPAAALAAPALLARTALGRTALATAGGATEGAAAGYGYQSSDIPTLQRLTQSIPMAALGGVAGGIGATAGARSAVPDTQAIPQMVDTTPQLTTELNAGLRSNVPALAAETAEDRMTRELSTPREAFTEAARSLYDDIDNAGLYVTANSFDNAVEQMLAGARLSDFDSVRRVTDQLAQYRGQSLAYSDLEDVRQFLNAEIRGASNGNEQRILMGLRDQFDDYFTSLQPGDHLLSQGATMTPQQAQETLSLARDNWRTSQKLDILDEIVWRAQNSQNPQTTLRTEMSRIVRNESLRRQFEPAELEAIAQLAQGFNRSAGSRLLNLIGRFAPTGLGGILGVTGALTTGNLAPLIPLAAGGAARGVLSNQTQRLFNNLYGNIANQVPMSAIPTLGQAVGAGAGMLAVPPTLQY